MRAYPVKAYHYGRFSSKKQEVGNSRVRQIEQAQEWCKRRGIALDETLSYFDSGTSAFRGKNRTHGALSLFLQECKEKRVVRGSYLLVESLDRLSRENLLNGQALIRELLRDHGIKIVTLLNGMEYTAENYQQTHWALDAEFDRAHSESWHKSQRSIDNWARRRKTLDKEPLTAKLPAWVKAEGGKLVEDTPKADVVRRIYRMSIDGFGTQSIAKKLNGEQVPPISGAALWYESYVAKLLSSRQVVGEFQPQKFDTEGKRVAAAPVVKGYFPVVVSEDTWQQNRNAMLARRTVRGRITPKVSNLFTALVYESGERCSFRATNFVGYLQPAKRATPGFKYAPFERAFLWWVREVQVCMEQGDDYGTVKGKADALDRQIRTLDAKIKADSSLIELGYLDTLADLKRQYREALDKANAAAVPLQSHFLHGQRLVETLATAKDDELETMRRALRMAIRQVVQRVDVVVEGDKYAGKRLFVTVTLKDEQQHVFWYAIKAGRVVEGGRHVKIHSASVPAEVEENGTAHSFPVDPDPLHEIKTRCKRMRLDEGQSYKEITAATGLDRITIYRYVHDYSRPKRKVE